MWIHEDDWAQVSIEPIENAGERADVAAKLAEFSAAHRAPGGIGWTDMMVVPPPAISIAARRIPLADLIALLGVAEIEPLATGYSSHSEPVSDGFGFRASGEPYWDRFYGIAKAGVVTDLNLTHATMAIADKLCALARWRLALVDLSTDAIVDLSDRAAIDAYLRDPDE